MGVGVQSEPGREAAQHTADGLDVHAVLQGECCEGVAEVVESDLGDASSLQHSLQHIIDAVRGNGAAVGGWKHIGVIGLALLFPQDFDCLG